MNPAPDKTQRIADRISPESASLITTSSTGALAFHDASQLMEFAKMMAVAQVAVPKHLRDNPGACLAIAIQASEWQMSPFAVANKSYSVNDRLAYEAQLINAVILRRAPIKGRFKIDYTGERGNRRCKVSAVLNDGETVEYESPPISEIKVQNSPLWKSDPDQQLFYFASRSMCRRHFPDVLLGVYTQDELQELAPEREVTPRRTAARATPLNPVGIPAAIEAPAEATTETFIEAETVTTEGNPVFDDFLLSIGEVNTAADLESYKIQCAEFEKETERTIAKAAVDKKAEALQLVWNGANFIAA